MVSEVINEVSLEWDVSKRMVPFWESLVSSILNLKTKKNHFARPNLDAHEISA